MKHRMVAIMATVVFLGIGVAVAVGSVMSDPMVSKSYLENTWIPQLSERLQKRAAQQTKELYQAEVGKLDAMGEQHVAQAEKFDGNTGGGYTTLELEPGDRTEFKTGANILPYSGESRLESGSLADVSVGETVESGVTLQIGHRYVVLSDAVLRQNGKGALGSQGTVVRLEKVEKEFPFTDVAAADWYYSAVDFVYQKGYFAGTSDTTFSPNASMTRAMLATVLYRLSGDTAGTDAPEFTDVPAGEWYSQGILWASKQGVVNGMGDGSFHPQDPVTRQQMVTMLYRYQRERQGTTGAAAGELGGFPDGATVADWAKEAVTWAVGEKLLNGRDTGYLDPDGTATRAEVATLLQRFSTFLGKS